MLFELCIRHNTFSPFGCCATFLALIALRVNALSSMTVTVDADTNPTLLSLTFDLVPLDIRHGLHHRLDEGERGAARDPHRRSHPAHRPAQVVVPVALARPFLEGCIESKSQLSGVILSDFYCDIKHGGIQG